MSSKLLFSYINTNMTKGLHRCCGSPRNKTTVSRRQFSLVICRSYIMIANLTWMAGVSYYESPRCCCACHRCLDTYRDFLLSTSITMYYTAFLKTPCSPANGTIQFIVFLVLRYSKIEYQ